ncbi:MAG TPA: class II aldolase/adducin family protein [bacterium]|jgi:ribulose-5-phosphate 4-epimerase/fuculose-1-phosphate aldolase
MKFTVVGSYEDPTLAWIVSGLKDVFARHDHTYVDDPDDEDLRLVINCIDVERPRPYRRKAKAVFVLSVAVTDQKPENVLKQAYPLLVRSLANLCLYLVRDAEKVMTYFVTLEQGYYAIPELSEQQYFEYIYKRLYPLASSQLVIDNQFDPDLEPALWNGDELTAQLSAAGKRLDALNLLPAPFPIHELLDERDLRHIERLYGIGGLSYGNLSVRRDGTRFWMSASGVDKSNMKIIGRDMLMVKGFDPERNVILLSVPPDIKPRRVSVDAIEHWMIYTEHPEVGAIVHVHAWMEDISSTTINYPCGTIQLAQAVADVVRESSHPGRAVVGLKNHGLTITGPILSDVFDRLERGFIRQVPMS